MDQGALETEVRAALTRSVRKPPSIEQKLRGKRAGQAS
jgi:hypothetical protein